MAKTLLNALNGYLNIYEKKMSLYKEAIICGKNGDKVRMRELANQGKNLNTDLQNQWNIAYQQLNKDPLDPVDTIFIFNNCLFHWWPVEDGEDIPLPRMIRFSEIQRLGETNDEPANAPAE